MREKEKKPIFRRKRGIVYQLFPTRSDLDVVYSIFGIEDELKKRKERSDV